MGHNTQAREMKSVLLPFALLALLAVAVVAEDANVASVDDEAEDDPAKQGKEELDKMDTNKDGKADLGEVTEYMKKEFYGPEDIKEENLTPEQVSERSTADAKEYLEELDKNKDSFLDLDEFTAHYKDDADDVDAEPTRPRMRMPTRMQQRMRLTMSDCLNDL